MAAWVDQGVTADAGDFDTVLGAEYPQDLFTRWLRLVSIFPRHPYRGYRRPVHDPWKQLKLNEKKAIRVTRGIGGKKWYLRIYRAGIMAQILGQCAPDHIGLPLFMGARVALR